MTRDILARRVPMPATSDRRDNGAWIRSHSLAVAIAAAVLACAAEPGDHRPSILLVVIDTLRADAASAYGAVEDTTPAFDRLATDGLLYGRAFAPSPWTLLSHASLFSGLRVDRHGVGIDGRMSLSNELTTIAVRLRDAGYATAGYSENTLVSAPFGMDQGFEQFAAVTIDEIPKRSENLRDVQFDIVEQIGAFTTQRDRSRPYFLFANLLDAHEPYRDREINRFLPPGVSAGTVWTPSRLKQTADLICDRLPSSTDVEILHGLYLGGVAEADAKLEKLWRSHGSRIRPVG
jgi:membrane-anchored protein YejM (alkaline phosphatase superfamily)